MIQLLEEFKEYIITCLISFVTGVVAYFQGKRKSTAETEVTETDVIKSIRELYTNLVEDMASIVEESRQLKEQMKELTKQVKILEQELSDCKAGILK